MTESGPISTWGALPAIGCEGGAFFIRPQRFASAVRLTLAESRMPGFAAALHATTGLRLPEVNRVSGERDFVLWLSPRELLFLNASRDATEVTAVLAAMVPSGEVLILDHGDGLGLLRCSGPAVRDLLCQGTAIDLDEGAFGPGDSRRTRLAQIDVTLFRPLMPEQDILLIFPAPLAAHLARWLAHATRGIGVADHGAAAASPSA